jgi:hypothetical protein
MPTLAAATGLSTSALYRHARHSGTTLAGLRFSENVSYVDAIGALADSLADLNSVRLSALMADKPDVLVRAATATRGIVAELTRLVGIEGDEETVAELRYGDALASAIARAIYAEPAIGIGLESQLRAQNEADMADEVGGLVKLALNKLEESAHE